MLGPSYPIQVKNPNGPLRVLMIGRISTDHQSIENIEASYEFAQRYLKQIYPGPVQIKHLGERGSGMLKNRESIREAEDEIETGTWDLVILEDLARAYRNTQYQIGFVQHCVDHDTRLISIGDALDTADPNWQAIMHVSVVRHGMYIPDTQRRVSRTASHAFKHGGMVQKVPFGYRKVSVEDAAQGLAGPKGLRIAKVPEATPIIAEMRLRVLRGDSYCAIARWLNQERVEPGPYVSENEWLGKHVNELLRSPLLRGERHFGKVRSKLIFSSGKHKREPNLNPEVSEHPEIAHMTAAEQDELWAVMDQGDPRLDQSKRHKRLGVPRRESLWPGQHIKCSICGDELYWMMADGLQCRHARPGSVHACWNQVIVNADMVRDKLLPKFVAVLRKNTDLWTKVIDAAWDEYRRTAEHSQRKLHDLDRSRRDLEQQSQRLATAISKRPDSETLLTQLDAFESDLKRVRREIEVEQTKLRESQTLLSRDEVEQQAERAILELARSSRTFGQLLSRTFPDLQMVPVQALDSPQVRPRVVWRLPEIDETGPIELVVDAFEASFPIQHAQQCQACREQHPRWTLEKIIDHLKLGCGTVKRALAYARKMSELGTTDPFRVLTDRPAQASRWRKGSLQPSSDDTQPDGESSD